MSLHDLRPDARDHVPSRRLRLRQVRRVTAATIDDATELSTPSPFSARPAWLLILVVDLLALAIPMTFVHHGRWSLVAMAVVYLLFLQASGHYRPRLKLSFFDDAGALVSRGGIAYLIVLVLDNAVHVKSIRAYTACAVFALLFQLTGRVLSYRLVTWARVRGVSRHDTLVVGSGEIAERIARTLVVDRTLGLDPVGFVSDGPDRPMVADLRHLGGSADLARVVDRTGAKIVIVAFNGQEDRAMVESLRRSERRGCDLFIVPRLFEIYAYGQSEHIGGIPVVRVRRPRLNRTTWTIKRAIDIAASSLGLLVLSPVLGAAALAVRIEGGPGVIFRQTRIGLDGRAFQLMKLRSLKPVDESESATLWNVSQDDRLGRVGRFLRRSSIDELPQLVNVLKGEMTLVGPRPERPHFVAQFSDQIPAYEHRHRVPAGLTGLAQVNGLRGNTSIEDRARYDNFYIENWSLWLDVKIIAMTVREVVGARGA